MCQQIIVRVSLNQVAVAVLNIDRAQPSGISLAGNVVEATENASTDIVFIPDIEQTMILFSKPLLLAR